MFDCKVVTDSCFNEDRISTLELTYPRMIHAEIMTHRDRARNAGSSRAIPWPVMCERIQNDPVIPIYWGSEQKGMQTGGEIEDKESALGIWLAARNQALMAAQRLANLGVHKSLCNRLTEPFMWITVVMTSTSWKNFFLQRCHKDAEIHFQKIANMARKALLESTPIQANEHLPYVQPDDVDFVHSVFSESCMTLDGEDSKRILGLKFEGKSEQEVLMQVSTARCARVSYVQHGEKKKSTGKDINLFSQLVRGSGFGHWSPMEHPAIWKEGRFGPFKNWKQYRKFYENECPTPEGYPDKIS